MGTEIHIRQDSDEALARGLDMVFYRGLPFVETRYKRQGVGDARGPRRMGHEEARVRHGWVRCHSYMEIVSR